MANETDNLGHLADAWLTAQLHEAEERTSLGARSGQFGAALGTHPALAPYIRDRREAFDTFACAAIAAALRGADLGPDALAIWEDYPEIDQPKPPFDGQPLGRLSQKQMDVRSRWVSGRQKFLRAVLRHLGRPNDLSGGAATKQPTVHPGTAAAQSAMKRAGLT